MNNETLIKTAKTIIKELLYQCTDEQQKVFKRMYSHNNLDLSINDVVDNMNSDNLDHAISQCEKTVQNNINNGQ